MNQPVRRALITLIILLCLWIQLPQSAGAQSGDTAKRIEAAKKEGELVIYGTTNLRQSTLINDKFQAKYPFINVKLNRLTSDNFYPRVIAETRSGKFLGDILQNNSLGMYFLKKGNFLARHESPDERAYAKEFKDPGYWTTLGPALVVPVGYGLATKAPHSNAAKLFIDFVLSQEGQRLVLSFERQSARADLAREQGAMKDVTLIPLESSLGENMEFYARQAQEIFSK